MTGGSTFPSLVVRAGLSRSDGLDELLEREGFRIVARSNRPQERRQKNVPPIAWTLLERRSSSPNKYGVPVDFPSAVDSHDAGCPTLKQAVCAFEASYITFVLHQKQFDKLAVATALDIGLSSLYRKMNGLGLSSPPDPSG